MKFLYALFILLLIPFVAALEEYDEPRSGFSADAEVRVVDTAVYQFGFVSTDGEEWTQFSFTGITKEPWILGEATADVSLYGVRYVAAYSCTWSDGWDCSSTWQVLDRGDQSSSEESVDSMAGDLAALQALYDSTNGDGWDSNDGWNGGEVNLSVHSPFGVTKEEIQGEWRVVEISLTENNLVGNLPSEIGGLDKLTYFNVKHNNLTGEIPASIGNWKDIEILYFAGRSADDLNSNPNHQYHPGKSNHNANVFSGEFPDVWANFSKLREFQLTGSTITRMFYESIGNCAELRYIVAAFNEQLEEELPASLSNLTKLQWLILRSNSMQGELPDFSSMTDLRNIHLGNGNSFSGEINFSTNTKLRRINLDNNDFSGDWPTYWNNGEFTNLVGIRATWNDFTGTLHGFENLTLHTFSMTGNNLVGSLPKSVTTNTGLIILSVGWNDMSGELPQNGWQEHTNTRYLRLNNNNFEGPIPDKLPTSSNLQFLRFQNNKLSGPISLDATKYLNQSRYPVFNYMTIENNQFSEEDYQPLLDEMGSDKLRVGNQNS